MSTAEFFHSRLNQTFELLHTPAVLCTRLPWAAIEAAAAPKLAHHSKPAKRLIGKDPADAFKGEFGGMDYYEPRLPCGATQFGRFQRPLGEDGMEQLLKASIELVVDIKAVDLERVIFDSTVQGQTIAHSVDSRLLEIARHKAERCSQARRHCAEANTCAEGKALHALNCAADYNVRWLLQAIARLGLGELFCALSGRGHLCARLAPDDFGATQSLRTGGKPTRIPVPSLGHLMAMVLE